jgi:hypothetical protein
VGFFEHSSITTPSDKKNSDAVRLRIRVPKEKKEKNEAGASKKKRE